MSEAVPFRRSISPSPRPFRYESMDSEGPWNSVEVELARWDWAHRNFGTPRSGCSHHPSGRSVVCFLVLRMTFPKVFFCKFLHDELQKPNQAEAVGEAKARHPFF